MVVAEALDRLSRDQEHVAALYKHLTFAGIKLVTLAEGEISELHVGLKGTMNALYLKDLAQKTRRGLEGRVREGRSAGGLCYGYDVVRETDANGEPVRGGRVINTAEAAVVRRIFQEFADGRSPRRIAFGLNADGIEGPNGGTWGPSTVNGNKERGTGFLNNELYIGRLVWNRLRYVKDPVTGKRVSRPNPPDEWVIQETPELRIVDQALWDRVRERQKAISKPTRPDCREPRPFWTKTRPRYLFSGLMKCGCCGGSYVKISANHFGCATARNKGKAVCDNLLAIRRDALENAILDGLRHRLMDPALFKEFVTEFHREINRLRAEESVQRTSTRDEVARIDRRLKRLVDVVLETDGPPAAMLDEMRVLEARKTELEGLIESQDEPEPLVHPNLAEVYRRKVAALNEALDDETTRDEAMDLIRSLVEKISLTPEEGQLRIDLMGELAGILALCDAGKKKPGAASGAGPMEQIKTVAGARYQRFRTPIFAFVPISG